jgi:uncharacterized protein (DUF1778 family)
MQYTFLTMKPKVEIVQIRVTAEEKDGFELAATLSGISLSSWVRERLRLTAIRELEGAGRRIPFIPEIPIGGSK